MLDGDPAAPEEARQPQPLFSPRLLWSNGWMIKMPLGTEVGLGPGHIVLDGDPATPRGTAAPPPIFDPCLLWPNGWMDQDAT